MFSTKDKGKPGGSSSSSRKKKDCQQWQRLCIAIFRGDPIDAYQFRHTGLLIQHLDQDGAVTSTKFLHVIGLPRDFERDESSARDPMSSSRLRNALIVWRMGYYNDDSYVSS